MDARRINATILVNQAEQLTDEVLLEVLAAADASPDVSLEGRRLAAACALSGHWPMTLCDEIARALLPGPRPAC